MRLIYTTALLLLLFCGTTQVWSNDAIDLREYTNPETTIQVDHDSCEGVLHIVLFYGIQGAFIIEIITFPTGHTAVTLTNINERTTVYGWSETKNPTLVYLMPYEEWQRNVHKEYAALRQTHTLQERCLR